MKWDSFSEVNKGTSGMISLKNKHQQLKECLNIHVEY